MRTDVMLRKNAGRLVAAFMLLLAFSAHTHSESLTTNLHMQARVLPRLSFRILDQPAILRIKKRDLKKESPTEERRAVRGKMVISVETNNPVGYILQVQALDSRLFSSVEIRLKNSGQTFHLATGRYIEIHIPNRGKDRDVNKLDFDFKLLPGIAAGRYPWPIAITARLL